MSYHFLPVPTNSLPAPIISYEFLPYQFLHFPTSSFNFLPFPTISYQFLTNSYQFLPVSMISYNFLPAPTSSYQFQLLAGRMHAVNREFVYIDFDDERFLPAKMVASACSTVASACSTVASAKNSPQFPEKVPKP